MTLNYTLTVYSESPNVNFKVIRSLGHYECEQTLVGHCMYLSIYSVHMHVFTCNASTYTCTCT